MKPRSLLIPFAVLAFAMTPAATFAKDRKVTVYRDNDGDGHYNKKTYKVPDHHRHNYHSPYYGHGYGYRPNYYGYRSPYYRYGYPRTSLGISVYSPPTYYTPRVYRGYDTGSSLARDVQTALRRQGYYRGPIDGDIGSGSRAAIRAYQRAHGLSPTGRIDSALLRSLRIG